MATTNNTIKSHKFSAWNFIKDVLVIEMIHRSTVNASYVARIIYTFLMNPRRVLARSPSDSGYIN